MARIDPLGPESVGELFDEVANSERGTGFFPNSILTMARVPGLPEAFSALGRVVYTNGLVAPELLILVGHVASTAAGCRYCEAHTAHGAEALVAESDKLAAVWEFETSDLFDDAERAALRLALHGGAVPNCVSDDDIEDARKYFTDDQIAALVAMIAMFGFLNRWNDTLATELEDPPREVGERILAGRGWEVGKHGP